MKKKLVKKYNDFSCEDIFKKIISTLNMTVEKRDPYTSKHQHINTK